MSPRVRVGWVIIPPGFSKRFTTTSSANPALVIGCFRKNVALLLQGLKARRISQSPRNCRDHKSTRSEPRTWRFVLWIREMRESPYCPLDSDHLLGMYSYRSHNPCPQASFVHLAHIKPLPAGTILGLLTATNHRAPRKSDIPTPSPWNSKYQCDFQEQTWSPNASSS